MTSLVSATIKARATVFLAAQEMPSAEAWPDAVTATKQQGIDSLAGEGGYASGSEDLSHVRM